MKAKHDVLTFLFILTVSIFGCKEESKIEEIPVIYQRLSCQSDSDFIRTFSVDKRLLFDSQKTTMSQMIELSDIDGVSTFVVISSQTKTAEQKSVAGSMIGTGYICNMPDEIFTRNIPTTGTFISYTGDAFELCEPVTSLPIYSYSNLVIKTLKIHIK